jgi:hypothetical protein
MPHPDLKDIRRVARQTHGSGSSSSSGDGFPLLCISGGILLLIFCIFNYFSNNGSTVTATRTIVMPMPALKWVSTPVLGTWKGKYFGKNVALRINNRRANQFGGELVIHLNQGACRISIHGVLEDRNHLAFQEKTILTKPAGVNWTLGVNRGSFSLSNHRISGYGSDAVNPQYTWWFLRAS